MIKKADKSMIPGLTALWHQSFGDSEAYIQMFLDWNFDKVQTIVYIAEDKPVSVAYLLPIEYMPVAGHDEPDCAMKKGNDFRTSKEGPEHGINCWYLYAAATLPEYRGRGYFGEILSFVRANIPEPVILVPGEESLISYYERQGLYLCQRECTMEVVADTSGRNVAEVFKTGVCTGISDKAYFALREQALAGSTHMRWNEHFIRYICHENRVCGGNQVRITIDKMQFAAMYRVSGEALTVLEVFPQTHIESCVQFLLLETGCRTARVCVQPPFMANKYLQKQCEDIYFNLTLG